MRPPSMGFILGTVGLAAMIYLGGIVGALIGSMIVTWGLLWACEYRAR